MFNPLCNRFMIDQKKLDTVIEKYRNEREEFYYRIYSGKIFDKGSDWLDFISIIDGLFSEIAFGKRIIPFKRIFENHFTRIWRKENNVGDKIIHKYRQYLQPSLVSEVRESLTSTKSSYERKYLNHLLIFLIEANSTFNIRDKNIQPPKGDKSFIKIDGKEIYVGDVDIRIQKEPNREKREKMENTVKPIIVERKKMFTKIQESYFETLSRSGYGNSLNLLMDTVNVDYFALKTLAEDLSSRTQSLYKSMLDKRLEKLKIPVSGLTDNDLRFASMGNEFDEFFKKDLLVPTLKSTLEGVWIDKKDIKIIEDGKTFSQDLISKLHQKKQKNIILDLEYRPQKEIRAICISPKIPEKTYLVVKPFGGLFSYLSVKHEMGHALHAVNTDPSLPSVLKLGGDYSVTEAYAFLFEFLCFNPEWVKEFTPLKNNPNNFIEFSKFNKMLLMRNMITRFLVEFDIESRKTTENAEDIYSQAYEKVLSVTPYNYRWFMHLDSYAGHGKYLMSLILEAQLEEYLQQNFEGLKWYKNKGAVNFIKNLLSFGCMYTAEEIGRFMGYDGLDVKPLLRSLEGYS